MSSETRKAYPFSEFEPRWQAVWESERTFCAPNPGDSDFDVTRPKFYALDMFPYPSGDGLHVGHPEGYTATDIISRSKRKQGFNVLHPMGWDAFGLPAEQYAIKTGQHPRVTTERNVGIFRAQLKRLGFAYDWDREVNTTEPTYFKWTQWIFLQIYGSWCNPATGRAEPISTYRGSDPDSVRLAYVAEVPVNWCPHLGTVLANEEVVDGRSEVGGFPVERRPMKQWMLRITAFADRLADELDALDWPAGIKQRQRDWIGRSEGAEVRFQVPGPRFHEGVGGTITVFTTRPDTLFGATYMVLAPEHPLVAEITAAEQKSAVAAYQQQAASKSDLDRGVAKTKTGVDTGAKAINPVNAEAIPIWIADYVMMGYGTGAIMAVPAHDERDFEFARAFGLPIREVVFPPGRTVLPACPALHQPAPHEQRHDSVGGGEGDAQAGAGQAGSTVLPSEASEAVPSSPTPFFETGIGLHGTTRHLPHWDQGDKYYFITWRLADSLPAEKLKALQAEKEEWLARHPKPWTPETEAKFHATFSDRIEQWLDEGSGACVLKDPALARVVASALRHFDAQRYYLAAFVVMPNHVHVAIRLAPGENLPKVLHSWKSFTSSEINKALGRTGTLWQSESSDRIIRNESHWKAVIQYIADNPIKARLVADQFNLYIAEPPQGRTGLPVCPAPHEPASQERGRGSVGGGESGARASAGQAGSPVLPSAFLGEGTNINSGFLDGLPTAQAKQKITAWLEERGLGKRTVHYKLRDWLFARQRYWGEPFPIVWEGGRHRALPEAELPLLPPDLEDFKPTGTPEPPLSKAGDWVRYSATATRELNTMPQWAGSCWYYLRFCDARNSRRFVGREAERYWMGGTSELETSTLNPQTSNSPIHGGVDLYVGGTEHAVLHLLYSRFWHKVLFDLGHVSTAEPFQKLVNQGLILGEDGQKMSKSRGNVVNPDAMIDEFGADALRLYEMFMGPLEQVKPWNTQSVGGVYRFLARVWRLIMEETQEGQWTLSPEVTECEPTAKQRKVLHETIKKVTLDCEAMSFNTAIAQMMVCTNEFVTARERPVAELVTLLHLLNPFAPHLTEELYASLRTRFPALPSGQLAIQPWPAWDEAALLETEVELVVQVNGKVRDRVRLQAGADEVAHRKASLASAKVQDHLAGLTVRKVIVIPGRLVNVVAN